MQTKKNISRLLSSILLLGAAACETTTNDGSMETGIPGETFSSLESTSDALSGVFVKGQQSLAFNVSIRDGRSELRVTTLAGEMLFSSVSSPKGSEMQVGTDFRSFLPAESINHTPFERVSSPVGFEMKGDLSAAFERLKTTSFVLFPYTAAALGRVGLDGSRSPLAMVIHLTALRLVEQEGFTLDRSVLDATNRIIAGEPPAGASTERAGGEDVTVKISALSENWSNTIRCNSGEARRFFGDTMDGDPCRDDCLGMCGPSCDPWYFLCGDKRVHATCWQHDTAYCPGWISSGLGFLIPNPYYPICMTEYTAYSAWIWGIIEQGYCEDTTTVPLGLYRSRPSFHTVFGRATATLPNNVAPTVRGFANFQGGVAMQSSDLPGYVEAHGAAQARDRVMVSGAFDGNFYHGTTSHTGAGYLPGGAPWGSPYSGQFWMLDMGTLKHVGMINIYPRTDYAPGPLTDIAVFVWVGSATVGWKQVADGASATLVGNQQTMPFPVGTVSQYVMIQKKNDSPLAMAEVEVGANNP